MTHTQNHGTSPIDLLAIIEALIPGQSFTFDDIEYTRTIEGVIIDDERHTLVSAADFLDVYYHYEHLDCAE